MDAVSNDEDKGPVPRAIKDFQRFMCFGLHSHLQHLADVHIHSKKCTVKAFLVFIKKIFSHSG